MERTITISSREYATLLELAINSPYCPLSNNYQQALAEVEALISEPLTVTEALKIMVDGGVLPDGYDLITHKGHIIDIVSNDNHPKYPYSCWFSVLSGVNDCMDYTLDGKLCWHEESPEFNLTLKTPTG